MILLGRCLCAVMLALALPVAAQSRYPERPVRVVVPVAAAGSTDIIARLTMSRVSELMGQTFVIDNRPGAGGLLGNEIVAQARPDGYTLLFTYAAHTIVPFIYRRVPYNVYKDFTPITLVGSQPLLLAVNINVPANSTQDLIALAKAKPNTLNVAWATPSSSGALAAELFKILTQTKMTSIPFKGGAPALTALVSGEVQLIFTTPPTVMSFIKSNRVKILGTSGKERAPYLPDVPTLAEAGVKNFETAPWQGLFGPANLPQSIVDALHVRIREVLRMNDTRDRIGATGTDIVGNTPTEFGRMLARELAQNKKVIEAVGMRAD